MKKYFKHSAFIILITFTSCAAEGYNLSPMSNGLSPSNSNTKVENAEFSLDKNINASEISQLISTFPDFRNDAVDSEISKLKVHLTNYLQATKAYNTRGKERSIEDIEVCYKKLQKLRKFLDADHNEILNRYLVRIKTNISEIETISNSDIRK